MATKPTQIWVEKGTIENHAAWNTLRVGKTRKIGGIYFDQFSIMEPSKMLDFAKEVQVLKANR